MVFSRHATSSSFSDINEDSNADGVYDALDCTGSEVLVAALQTQLDDLDSRVTTLENPATTTSFVSVSAMSGISLTPSCQTTVAIISPFIGRYLDRATTNCLDDYIIVPIQIPHGATITAFSCTAYASTSRSPSNPCALRNSFSRRIAEVRYEFLSGLQTVTTTDIARSIARVDNDTFAYYIYMPVTWGSATTTDSRIIQISASVEYSLP